MIICNNQRQNLILNTYCTNKVPYYRVHKTINLPYNSYRYYNNYVKQYLKEQSLYTGNLKFALVYEICDLFQSVCYYKHHRDSCFYSSFFAIKVNMHNTIIFEITETVKTKTRFNGNTFS